MESEIRHLTPIAGAYRQQILAGNTAYLFGKASDSLGAGFSRWSLDMQTKENTWSIGANETIEDVFCDESFPAGVVFAAVKGTGENGSTGSSGNGITNIYVSTDNGLTSTLSHQVGTGVRLDGTQCPDVWILSRGICYDPDRGEFWLAEYNVSDSFGVSSKADLVFTAPNRIESTTTELDAFKAQDVVTVSGTTSNNLTFTVESVDGDGFGMTVSGNTVTNESPASASIGLARDLTGATGRYNQSNVYRSTDNGLTWSLVYTWGTAGDHQLRHFHGIRYNPYNGYIYLLAGDTDTELGVMAFDPAIVPDIGDTAVASVNAIDGAYSTQANTQSVRFVDVLFDKSYLYGTSDSQTSTDTQGIFRLPHDLSSVARVHPGAGGLPEPDNRTGWLCAKVDDQLVMHDIQVATGAVGARHVGVYAARIQSNGVAGQWRQIGTMEAAATRAGIVRGAGFFAVANKMYIHTAGMVGHSGIDCTYRYQLGKDYIDYDNSLIEPDVLAPVFFIDPVNGDNASDGLSSYDNSAFSSKPKQTLGNLLDKDSGYLPWGCRIVYMGSGSYSETDGDIFNPAAYGTANFQGDTGRPIQVTGQGRGITKITNAGGYATWFASETDEAYLLIEDLTLHRAAAGRVVDFYTSAQTDATVVLRDMISDDYALENPSGECAFNFRPLTGSNFIARRSMLVAPGTDTVSDASLYFQRYGGAGNISEFSACILVGGQKLLIGLGTHKWKLLQNTVYGPSVYIEKDSVASGEEPTFMNNLGMSSGGQSTYWYNTAGNKPDGLGNHQDYNILSHDAHVSAHTGPNDSVGAITDATEVITTPGYDAVNADWTPKGTALGFCVYRPVKYDYNRNPFDPDNPSAGAVEGQTVSTDRPSVTRAS